MDNIETYVKYVGQTFDGRYRILKTIGVGGMAAVFEAYDLLEKRTVAVKMLKDDIAGDEKQVQRFVNESKAVAMLSHPNIIKIFNVSVKSDIKFIVMEYVEGITLKDYMTKRGVLSFGEIISYSEQILHALEHAHAKGIVHRDIKPQNIMLLKNGTVKVTDFGIAKLPNAETMTITDKAIGTVYYISPEQAEGRAIDQRSDLYSLGAMMYEMSCGRLPFYDESPISVALMQIKNDPEPPRAINPAVPRGLEQIILSAMEKNPALRFQSATQMLRQIARLKADPNIVFRPNPKLEEARRRAAEGERAEANTAQKRESSSMVPMLLGIISALLLVAITSVIYYITSGASVDAQTIAVPNVVGQIYTNQDAIGLHSAYYEVEIVERSDADARPGEILEQTPSYGQEVKVVANTQRCKVELVVSSGPETAILDNYEGQSRRDVGMALRKQGFIVNEQPIYSDTIANGKVCYTSPAAGEPAVVGTTVIVYYSLGRTNGGDNVILVPDFRGKTETAAREMAKNLSLTLDVSYVASEESTGTVLEQSPEPDSAVPAKTKIALTVSGGPSYVEKTVPNILGMTVAEAKRELEKVGLVLGKETQASGELKEGQILEQSPVPGTAVTANVTRVDYTVCNGSYQSGGTITYMDCDGYRVPNVVGLTVDEARAILEDDCLTLGTGTVVKSSEPIGRIVAIGISREDGTGYPVVDYEVSGGPNYVYN